jgi:hypothetical protein
LEKNAPNTFFGGNFIEEESVFLVAAPPRREFAFSVSLSHHHRAKNKHEKTRKRENENENDE